MTKAAHRRRAPRLPGAPSDAPPPSRKPTPITDAVVELFETILDVDGLGPDDDFFDLGGTSMLGVKLAARLEHLLGRRVPLVLLFQESTPRALAAALARLPSNPAGCSIELQPGEGDTAVFCAPDFFGLPLTHLGLARRLSPAHPVFGLTPGPLRTEMIRRPSIGLLTRAYVEEVRRRQPRGPYVVSGYSAGSVPAFDLACALEAQGERVLLVLLDPLIHRSWPPPRVLHRWWREHVLTSLTEVGAWRTGREALRLRNSLLHVQRVVAPFNVPGGVPPGDRRLARSMLQAEVDWRPRRFAGPVVLAQLERQSLVGAFMDHDGMNGWGGFFQGEVRSFRMATDHGGLMREPHVGALAHRLAPLLARFVEGETVR